MSDPVSSQLISVIVPVYKVEKYLARCVDSIMGRPWTLSRFDLAESRFRRAAIYAKSPGYEEAAVKTLLLGTEQMYSKALAILIRKIGDRTHRTPYRELERLIREAYRSIRESGVSLRVQDRVWLRLCCVSWVGAWLVRWPLRKINKMTKKEQQPNGPLAKAEALGVKEKVLFLGQMGDVSRWYQAMDCFVMPSLFEGLPVVGIEAQAAGLPCVFSDRVTDEVLIMPHACRVSLEEGTGTWAEAILYMSENTDRAEGVTLVREAGYDIRTESGRLEKRYLELGS